MPFSLTEFNKLLVDQYLDIPWVNTQCGYACSDQCVVASISPLFLRAETSDQRIVAEGWVSQRLHHWYVPSAPADTIVLTALSESQFGNSNKNIHSTQE